MIFSCRRILEKTNERILLYYYETSGWLVFVYFLEEIEDTKKTFRNYLTFNMHVLSISIFWSRSYCLLLAICQGLNECWRKSVLLFGVVLRRNSFSEGASLFLWWLNLKEIFKLNITFGKKWKWKIRMLLQLISPQMCFMHTCRIFRDTMSFFPCQVPPASAHHISDRPCHDQEDYRCSLCGLRGLRGLGQPEEWRPPIFTAAI